MDSEAFPLPLCIALVPVIIKPRFSDGKYPWMLGISYKGSNIRLDTILMFRMYAYRSI